MTSEIQIRVLNCIRDITHDFELSGNEFHCLKCDYVAWLEIEDL